MRPDASWLPADFTHPTRVPLPSGRHLRPIRASDLDLDLVAVRGSQPRLWERYGRAWGWPPAGMTAEQDYLDLHRHEQEVGRHESFNYALLDRGETALLGCVYVDPPEEPGNGAARVAEVSWWVVDELAGTPAEDELAAYVPAWLAQCWPFDLVSYPFGERGTPGSGDPGAAGPADGVAAEPPPLSCDPVRTPLPPLDLAAAEAMWRDFLAADPDAGAAGGEHGVEAFGDSVELADDLVGLVLRGVKTATASLVRDYAGDQEPLPRIGAGWVVCDGSGRPRVVLRTVALRLGPVDSVDDAFAWAEGEQDRTRTSWLEGHQRFWERSCSARGETFALTDEAVFEQFRVVWPPAAVARAAMFADSVAARTPEDVSRSG